MNDDYATFCMIRDLFVPKISLVKIFLNNYSKQ